MSEQREVHLTVADMAARTGVSAHTLRYYERAGLIRAVARTSGNQRRYSTKDVDWFAFLLKLRATGMPIRRMKHYADLREEGEPTVTARLELLTEHQRTLQAQLAELRAHDEMLSEKIALYRSMLRESGRARVADAVD